MRRSLGFAPIFGILLFVTLNFWAAALYPGGTKFNRAAPGYSHLRNFWCDLLDPIAYNGEVNHGRPVALAATVLCPLLFIPFWYSLAGLFAPASIRSARFVRVTGCSSMFLAAFMPIAHDAIIDVVSGLSFLAFVSSQVALWRSREFRLVLMASGSMLLCAANFLMWWTGYLIEIMPIIQKAAFLFSFLYVGVATFYSYQQTSKI